MRHLEKRSRSSALYVKRKSRIPQCLSNETTQVRQKLLVFIKDGHAVFASVSACALWTHSGNGSMATAKYTTLLESPILIDRATDTNCHLKRGRRLYHIQISGSACRKYILFKKRYLPGSIHSSLTTAIQKSCSDFAILPGTGADLSLTASPSRNALVLGLDVLSFCAYLNA